MCCACTKQITHFELRISLLCPSLALLWLEKKGLVATVDWSIRHVDNFRSVLTPILIVYVCSICGSFRTLGVLFFQWLQSWYFKVNKKSNNLRWKFQSLQSMVVIISCKLEQLKKFFLPLTEAFSVTHFLVICYFILFIPRGMWRLSPSSAPSACLCTTQQLSNLLLYRINSNNVS